MKEHDEKANRSDAVAACESAVKWLLEATRDSNKFPLVLKENTDYGFRRNLFGTRSFGIAISLLSLVVIGLVVGNNWDGDPQTVPSRHGLAAAFCAVDALLWIFIVTEDFVQDAGHSYARALLAACDSELLGNGNAK